MAPSTDNELEGSKKCAEQEFTFFLKKGKKEMSFQKNRQKDSRQLMDGVAISQTINSSDEAVSLIVEQINN